MVKAPASLRAYRRKVIEDNFIIDKQYSFNYICEAVGEEFPVRSQSEKNRIWAQMKLAGAIWEPVEHSRLYTYKGLGKKPVRKKEAKKKENTHTGGRTILTLKSYLCGKKKIIDAYGKNRAGYISTDYLGYNELALIYYGRRIPELVLPVDCLDKDTIRYKAIITLNQVIRDSIYKIFRRDFYAWSKYIDDPLQDMLVAERKNQIIHAYQYENPAGEVQISDGAFTKEIDRIRKQKHAGRNKRALYGHKINPYRECKEKNGIYIYHSVWKIIFPNDVPQKYHKHGNEVQIKIDKRLQDTVYRYLNSDRYNDEIRVGKKISRKSFDSVIMRCYNKWVKTIFSSSVIKLTEEENKKLSENLAAEEKGIDTQLIDEENEIYPESDEVMIGVDGDIAEDEDFISYSYDYED